MTIQRSYCFYSCFALFRGRSQQPREEVVDNYVYATTRMIRQLSVLDRACPLSEGQNDREFVFWMLEFGN